MRISYKINSFNELDVHGYKWTAEGKNPKAVVILSHGMAETIERYDRFANFLVESGIFVYGHSHRGHGKTALSVDRLGYLGENGWSKMKEDLKVAIDMARKDYPSAKIVLMGHSMGSFLARDFLLDYSTLIDGAILSGTGYTRKFELVIGRSIAAQEMKKYGEFYKSERLDKLSFGSFNKGIKNPRTDFDWLSSDEKEVDKYINDPYCGQVHPSSFFHDFADNLIRILHLDNFRNKRSKLPIFIFSGSQDPVGSYGKGVVKVADYYKKNGFDVQLKLYEGGRHEMLNEISRDEVFDDIYNWIQNKII